MHAAARRSTNRSVDLSTAVREALQSGQAVVALESTIIAHGLPYPENLRCASELERTIRTNGAIPATIAVINGCLCAGLHKGQLQDLAEQPDRFPKLSLRDLPMAIARRSSGATTVSATAYIANLVGIRVFATGGIGGVHHGPHLDVSQDLLALATLQILVVCAGVKSVLDIPRTLEVLEAAAVPVFVWKSNRFPAFYSPDSGCSAPAVVQDAKDMAAAFNAARGTGMLLAVPIPSKHAVHGEMLDCAIRDALVECENLRISGKNVTPFLLRRVAELSKGDSLRANVALALHNAAIATKVAVELATFQPTIASSPNNVVVVGTAAVDIICTPTNSLLHNTSTPGHVVRALGGVACNVARAAAASEAHVALVAALGDDNDGQLIRKLLRNANVRDHGLIVLNGARTPVYCAMHDAKGELQSAVADMGAVNAAPNVVAQTVRTLLHNNTRIVALDANLSPESLRLTAKVARDAGVLTWFEPTSVPKAIRVISALHLFTFISPNIRELFAIARALGFNNDDEAQAVRRIQNTGVRVVIATRGVHGAALYDNKLPPFELPALPVTKVRNTSGAGDALAGAMISHIARNGAQHSDLRNALRAGIRAAALACERIDSAAYEYKPRPRM